MSSSNLERFLKIVCAALRAAESDFLSLESMGVNIKRCAGCNHCKDCNWRATHLSYTQNRNLSVIEASVTFDEAKRAWIAEYPTVEPVENLANNRAQCAMMMERTERRLARGNQLNAFNEEFDAIVERGVFRKLTDAEISRWNGPVHYTPLTEMYKKGDNVTTPLRICSNSAMMYKGKSLNSVLIKGGNSAPDLFAMLVKFRFYPVGLTRDCTKFYNCVF